MNEMRVEEWCGYEIRFVNIDGEWWAILKDICDALGLRTAKIAERLHPDMLKRVLIETSDLTSFERTSDRKRGDNKTRWMLAVNEYGIYDTLFASRKLEAHKFRLWTYEVLQKLRRNVGLEQYEVMRMTEPEIQDEIDYMLDSIYYDEETGMLMQSITVEGGDVDQIPFE